MLDNKRYNDILFESMKTYPELNKIQKYSKKCCMCGVIITAWRPSESIELSKETLTYCNRCLKKYKPEIYEDYKSNPNKYL